MRLDAHELGGLEIRDHDDRAPDELLGLVRLGDSRYDLARRAAHLELELQEFLRAFDLLGRGYRRGAQVEGREGFDADKLGFGGGGCEGG